MLKIPLQGERCGQQLASMWYGRHFVELSVGRQAGEEEPSAPTTHPPHLSGCQECHISGGYLRAREIAAQLRADN